MGDDLERVAVDSANGAYAFASCNACTTVAVSFQLVLIAGRSQAIKLTVGRAALVDGVQLLQQGARGRRQTRIAGDPIEEIRRLKEKLGHDIVQYGFGRLSHALMEHGLLDELRVWVHPLFVGRGGPHDLIHRDAPTAMFELRDTTPLRSGTVILGYAAT